MGSLVTMLATIQTWGNSNEERLRAHFRSVISNSYSASLFNEVHPPLMTQLLMVLEMNNNPALQAGLLLLKSTWTLLSTQNKNKGLERPLSSLEHLLLWQRSRVRFLAPTWWPTTILTPVQGDPLPPSDVHLHQVHRWYTYMHIHACKQKIHTHKIKNLKTIKKLRTHLVMHI